MIHFSVWLVVAFGVNRDEGKILGRVVHPVLLTLALSEEGMEK